METLSKKKSTWLVTGAAGFIGSNISEFLLLNNQKVIGLDNFLTGKKENIKELESIDPSNNFSFLEKDISLGFNINDFKKLEIDYVIHQAALGSVPRSIEYPLKSHQNNDLGFINVLNLCKDLKVKKLVYASSSSVYGDHEDLPKVENIVGNVLSPYAATKKVNEIYADVFSKVYGLDCIGLRYFNVFGKRQDPYGAYAAVIPKWISGLKNQEEIFINGDGTTSRDFCYVKNAVQANIKSALSSVKGHEVFNVACNKKTSLKELVALLVKLFEENSIEVDSSKVLYRDFRAGDIKHSLADISKAQKILDYRPEYFIEDGLKEALSWYLENLK